MQRHRQRRIGTTDAVATVGEGECVTHGGRPVVWYKNNFLIDGRLKTRNNLDLPGTPLEEMRFLRISAY